jgi:hypothetical protein
VKTIITSIGAYTTGAEIADTVAAYGLALARCRDLDLVDIPFVTAEGSLHRAQLRIGWLVETVVTSDEQAEDDLIEVDTILDLLAKVRALSPAQASVAEPECEISAMHRGSETRVDPNWDEII